MSEKVPDQITKVLEKLSEKEKLPPLPKCDLCGSQLREDGKCICIRYIVKEKEE